jgi:class 3 adenylate cyclase/tetratricopeptide (TPR) repeat protein
MNEMCPRCGEALPPKANFCPNCGAPLVVPEASERRLVTVVFVDLARSTELASQIDPERFREVLAAFHGMISEEVSWLGGVAEGFIGDAVLGVFGTPVARDDDAVRAVRAALSIRDRAERLGRQLGLPLPMRVRIGVRTGQVAVGTPSDRNIVFGSEVNIGARLQQAAEPGEILAGGPTYELTRHVVEFGAPRELAAKGLEEPITAWPVLGMSASGWPDRSSVPMVNRRRELTLLSDTFDRAASRGRAHLVTLLGEPGIGKSRVVSEFLARLPEGTRVLAGRASPFEEEATYSPLADMVLGQLGAERDTPEEDLIGLLRRAVSGWVGPDEYEKVVRGLGSALGFGEPDAEDERFVAAEVRRGVLSMLAGLAAGGPVVMVIEDLQSADPLLLDMIEQLVKEARRLPVMVVCVARWDFLEDRPSWAGGLADAVTLWVEPLAPEHAARLAAEAGGLDEADAERVAQHAGGNPLFIIEITGMLLREERDLPPEGPAPSGRLLPATVQAVIASRIDQMSAAARDLVRRASVFPRGRFGLNELAIIVEPQEELLREAEEEELLVQDPGEPGVWRFRSDVLREVAYESLAKRERERLHLEVATELASPDLAERYPRTIAFHLEQAARASLDLDPKDRTLADRAVDALTRAGDIARRRIESRAAADLYQRALAMAGPEERWGAREAWVLSMLGEARYWLGEFDAAEDLLRKAMSLSNHSDDRVVAHAARFLADITLTIRGDDHLAAALFDHSLEAARKLEDPYVLARTLLMAGWVPYWRNRMDEARALFEEALAAARSGERSDAWAECRALVGLASVMSPTGSEEAALAIGLEALEIGERSGQGFTTAIAHQTVAASLRRLMRLDESLEHADASVRGLRELGARWELASALGDRGAALRLSGRLEEAERDLWEAFALCRDLSERALVTWTASELVRTLVAAGDLAKAHAVVQDPLAWLSDRDPASASAMRLAESVIALAEGDRDTALARSLAALEGQGGLAALPNPQAAIRWWTGALFGADAAGGREAVESARELLQRNGWLHALAEVEMAPALVRPPGDG